MSRNYKLISLYTELNYQSNVNPKIYDALYYVENNAIVFNGIIDMKYKLIIGVKDGDQDQAAVNLKQVTNL